MNLTSLVNEIKSKQSFLCVGLDTDVRKLPDGIEKNEAGILTFNKAIIDATKDFAVAYKINTAFYEHLGAAGWRVMEETRKYIPDSILKIADAKRGDIGNTSTMYAEAFFNTLDFDAVTVAPYMGYDSVQPFLEFKDKFTIVLGLTSNKGSVDFQTNPMYDPPLYQTVLNQISNWGTPENLMFVVGATKAEKLQEIRSIIPDHFLLIPGVGAQGGNASEVCINGKNNKGGLLINSSRGIIYSSNGTDFAEQAHEAASKLAEETQPYASI